MVKVKHITTQTYNDIKQLGQYYYNCIFKKQYAPIVIAVMNCAKFGILSLNNVIPETLKEYKEVLDYIIVDDKEKQEIRFYTQKKL